MHFIIKKLLFIVMMAVLGLTACGPTPEELVEQGKKHVENENYTEAMACFKKAADKGSAEAEYNIADLYWDGLGVEEDHETASEWIKKSAEKDYPEAQNALGAMYYYGVGVPQDFEKAAKWAKKAVSYDIEGSQFILASLYFAGKGVPQDFDKAAELLLKVEKKGGDMAKDAQSVLCVMYLEGWGVPQNDDKAVEMIRKAGGLTLAEAQFRIGELYGEGNQDLNIKKDLDKAVKWFRRAAENGNATAQFYMGNAYQKGLGVAKSMTDAKYWWQKAADQGHEKAKEALRSVAKAEAEAKAKAAEEARKKAYEEAFHNKTFTVNGVSFEMIAVKGGTFTMGCTSEQGSDCRDDEKPAHSVTLSDYYIGKYEVTQDLWYAVMGFTMKEQRNKVDWSWPMMGEGDNYPMYYLNWSQCVEFVRKLNQLTGENFRLPTEAEWEYAARGDNKSKGYKYSGSNNLNDVAWCPTPTNESGTKLFKPVGTKAPNELGIYDMCGNVMEWCQDWYGNYSSESQTNPKGPSSGWQRVIRSGIYSKETYYLVSHRYYFVPDFQMFGFRLALGN